jgi:hypothetical protein
MGEGVTHDKLQESVDAFMQLPSVPVRLRGRIRPVYALKPSNMLQTRQCVRVFTHKHTLTSDTKNHRKIKGTMCSGIRTQTLTHSDFQRTLCVCVSSRTFPFFLAFLFCESELCYTYTHTHIHTHIRRRRSWK